MYRFYPLYKDMIKDIGTYATLSNYTYGTLAKYTNEYVQTFVPNYKY